MREMQLKCVLVREPETTLYTPLAHNLTVEEANDRLQGLSDEERTGKVIDQDGRHRATDALKCKACKELAERIGADETSTEAVATT